MLFRSSSLFYRVLLFSKSSSANETVSNDTRPMDSFNRLFGVIECAMILYAKEFRASIGATFCEANKGSCEVTETRRSPFRLRTSSLVFIHATSSSSKVFSFHPSQKPSSSESSKAFLGVPELPAPGLHLHLRMVARPYASRFSCCLRSTPGRCAICVHRTADGFSAPERRRARSGA